MNAVRQPQMVCQAVYPEKFYRSWIRGRGRTVQILAWCPDELDAPLDYAMGLFDDLIGHGGEMEILAEPMSWKPGLFGIPSLAKARFRVVRLG